MIAFDNIKNIVDSFVCSCSLWYGDVHLNSSIAKYVYSKHSKL